MCRHSNTLSFSDKFSGSVRLVDSRTNYTTNCKPTRKESYRLRRLCSGNKSMVCRPGSSRYMELGITVRPRELEGLGDNPLEEPILKVFLQSSSSPSSSLLSGTRVELHVFKNFNLPIH